MFLQPLLRWKSSKHYIFWACVCSIRYAACNAHAPYCHLWPARLYNIFPHYLINGTIFGKKITELKMCVLIFYKTYVWNISHSNKKWAIYDKKNLQWSSCYVHAILVPVFRFHTTGIFSTDFLKKNSNIKFHENPSSESRVVPYWQTGKYDEANIRFSQFCECA